MHASDSIRDKRSHRVPCKLSGRLREKTVWWEVQRVATTIMAVAEKVKATKCLSGGGKNTATQLSEQRSRRTGNSTLGRQLRTLRYDTQSRYKTRTTPTSAIWPWMVRYSGFCVMRYARERVACGIIPFMAAYDRDYMQETVPLAETILFNILAPEHRGLSSGKTA